MVTVSLANNSVAQFISVTVIFLVVLAVTYFTTRWIGSYQKKQISCGNIKIVESLRLSGNKILEVVNAVSYTHLTLPTSDLV